MPCPDTLMHITPYARGQMDAQRCIHQGLNLARTRETACPYRFETHAGHRQTLDWMAGFDDEVNDLALVAANRPGD